jgi:osmoprotectant transport system permease protein
MMAAIIAPWTWLRANPDAFQAALVQHLALSATGLLLGVVLAFPAALLLADKPRLAEWASGFAGLLRTLPSLAVLAALLPLLGVGFTPSVVALALLALPPVLLHGLVGLQGVQPSVLEAARAMGLSRRQRLFQVELPLALPQLFAGLRTAAVQVVSGAALATFIGGGGLGDLVTQGMALLDTAQLLAGAIAIALLALVTEAGFALLQHAVTPR